MGLVCESRSYQHADYQYGRLRGTEVLLLVKGVVLLGHQFLWSHGHMEAPQDAGEDLKRHDTMPHAQPTPSSLPAWFM